MKWIGVLLFLCQFLHVYAEKIEYQIDEKVIQGELSNGLTYYVRHNEYPQESAALRLVIEVGSLYEKENEKGIAHMVEHMVFRGSRHFADEESIKYLESIGAWYGPDTNAATGFESTRYEFNIPLEKEEVLEKALLILSDFAAYATFPKEAMEIERGVILNELHQRTGTASWRLFEKEYNFLTAGSNYQNHFPIGLLKVVQTAPIELIRDFYHRWYRPDRMAVIAVGDFEPEKVVKLIEKLFGEIPCPEEEVEEPSFEIEAPLQSKVLIHYDPELTSTDLSLMALNQNEENSDDFSFEEAKTALISYLALSLLDDRLDKLSDEQSAPVLSAGAMEMPFTALYSGISIDASFFENRWKEGVKVMHEEIRRASEFGFTTQEWKKLQKQLLRGVKFQLQNLDRCEHEEFVDDCIDHFLEGDPLVDPEWSLRLSLRLIEDISIEDINGMVMPWDDQRHWVIIMSTPSREIVDQVSPEFLLGSFQSEEHLELSPPVERMLPENILGIIDSIGHIEEFSQDESLGVAYMTLNNGIKFVLKPSDFEKGSIEIYAQAKHGYASLPQASIDSARLSVPYFYRSGVGNLNGDQLSEYLETEGIGLYLGVGYNYRSIILTSHDQDKRPLFELLHALFTVPKFDAAIWDKLVDQTHEYFKERLNDPQTAFDDFAWQFNTQNHFLFQPLNLEMADAKTSRKVFERAFGNPSDFTFIVVGDFDVEEMKKLAIEYIGSIPQKDVEPLSSFQIPVLFPKVFVQTEFKLGSLPHCETVVSIPFDLDDAFEHFGNNYYTNAAKLILEQRLVEVLRKKMGGTYHVGVSINSLLAPSYENSMLQITFSSPRAEIDKMVQGVFLEIAKMKESLPEEEEAATVRELFRADKKMSAQSNSYWISMIHASEMFDVSLKKILNFEERISSITPEVIYEAAQYLFASPYYSILSHVPE